MLSLYLIDFDGCFVESSSLVRNLELLTRISTILHDYFTRISEDKLKVPFYFDSHIFFGDLMFVYLTIYYYYYFN